MQTFYSLTLYILLVSLSMNLHAFSTIEIFGKLDLTKEASEWFARSDEEKGVLQQIQRGEIPPLDIEMDALPQALSKELKHDIENISHAKKVAKFAFLEAIRKNWTGKLETSLLNESDLDSFDQAKEPIVNKIQKDTLFIGEYEIKGHKQDYYLFMVGNIGHVIVAKDFSSSRVSIQLGNQRMIHKQQRDSI